MTDRKFIDVDKIIEQKNRKLKKWLPGFVVRYLKRIIHQKEINEFLQIHGELRNQAFCAEVKREFNLKVEVSNIDRIPKKGKVVIAMNHPLGGMDAIILVDALKDHRTDIKFIVNDILMHLENMKDLFVGVNKVGKNDRSLKDQINTLFESDQAICLFPAGLVSRKQSGEIKDLVWKKTFVTYARKHGQTIVPVYIDGQLSPFFYRLANFRKFIGVKFNVEMLYLVNELFKQRNKTIRFIVGEPISAEEMEQHGDQELANMVKQRTYELKN